MVYADGPVTWEPEEPQPGDSITIVYDATVGTIPVTSDSIMLHWGINETSSGAWMQPPAAVWPTGSKPWPDNRAIQSKLTKISDDHWEITIATLDTFRTVHFVFRGFVSPTEIWDNNFGANWDISLVGGEEPVEHTDTVTVEVLVDLGRAIQLRGFTYGDTVEARLGFFGTAARIDTVALQRQGVSRYYKGSTEVVTTIGDTLNYGYFAYKNAQTNWEVYYNFDYTGETQGEAQYRQIPVSGETVVVEDTISSQNAAHRPPFFRNTSVVAQNVQVTLTCDVRPAYYHLLLGGDPLEDIQGDLNVTHPDSVLALGVAVNGPITGSWSNPEGPDWGAHLMDLDNKRMHDDGTHGDAVAGDSIFSITFNFYLDSSDVVGQEFKFGIGGGDNEGGYGNNHVENIDDFQAASTIDAQFGSIDPVFYSVWNYDQQRPSGIYDRDNRLPYKFELKQNYPNPFNPVTKIEFSIPMIKTTHLTIYNMLGQIVTQVSYNNLQPGNHTFNWDGKNMNGFNVASGIYFYELRVDNQFRDIKKMVLMK